MTTCSICLSRIKIFQKTQTLECNHRFHKKCIQEMKSTKCPNCNCPILSTDELMFFQNKTIPSDITRVLKESVRRKNFDLVDLLVQNGDPSVFLVEAIELKNVRLVERLIRSKKINWHRSISGKTFVEYAVQSKNNEIINMILDKTGFDLTK